MIPNNYSSTTKNNRSFTRLQAVGGEGNRKWLARILKTKPFFGNGLILLGGSSVVDFHIRVAQSRLRHNLTPSHWSMLGIMTGSDTFYTVPLGCSDDISELPHRNGIQECSLKDFDDPDLYPNIAYVEFTSTPSKIVDSIENLKYQRNVADLPALIIRWLEYVWAVGEAPNPLVAGNGIPSAVFAEVVYGIEGIELTPGLASASSCPEAVWQAAKWWRPFYEETARLEITGASATVPTGCFALRQPAAAIHERRTSTPPKKSRGPRRSRAK